MHFEVTGLDCQAVVGLGCCHISTRLIPIYNYSPVCAATQEGAYIKALTSAMIAYEISRACFDGYLLGECDCSFHLYSFASHNTHYTVCESKLAISLKVKPANCHDV